MVGDKGKVSLVIHTNTKNLPLKLPYFPKMLNAIQLFILLNN